MVNCSVTLFRREPRVMCVQCSFVRPGAQLDNFTKEVEKLTEELTEKDSLLVYLVQTILEVLA